MDMREQGNCHIYGRVNCFVRCQYDSPARVEHKNTLSEQPVDNEWLSERRVDNETVEVNNESLQ